MPGYTIEDVADEEETSMPTHRSPSERRRGPATSIESERARVVAVDAGKAAARLEPDPAGPASAPAIVTLAHAAALAAGASVLGARPGHALDHLQTVQLSVDLFRPDSRGALVAEAEVTYRGRSTLVVAVRVHDADRRLVAALVATQLATRPAVVTPLAS